jgi:hypothetical protein
MLGDGGEDLNREAVGCRVVDGDEVHLLVMQLSDERYRAREPVELGDNEYRAVHPAVPKGGFKGRTIRPTTALNLFVFGDQFVTADEGPDGFALGVQAKAGLALAFRGHSIIGDITRTHDQTEPLLL